jgi:hypothetical protein
VSGNDNNRLRGFRHAEAYRCGEPIGCICPGIFLAMKPSLEHRRRLGLAGCQGLSARAAQAEREREAAKVAAAAAEGEAKGLRLALEEARRPFWRRWLG